MPFKFKLSKRLALMKAALAAGAVLTLACTSDLTDPRLHHTSATPSAIAADLTTLAATAVTASGYQDPNVPQNTLDNNLATRWSANGDGQWIRYDLGTTMTVGAVSIAWYQGTSWASAFEIQVSLDGTSWTSVFNGRSSGQTLQAERYDFPTVTARYVRIVGHGQWSGTTQLSLWNSITEVAISASTTALVTSAPVAAVTASGYQDPNVPQNTLDNNVATRWSAYGDGQWIRYDLGSTMSVGPVNIAWYLGTSWASAFEIQVSLDGTSWTSVFNGRSSGRTLQAERYTFPAIQARYVRIVGHGQWSGTTQLSLWNSITEVAIYQVATVTNPGTVTDLAVVGATGTGVTLTFTEVNDGTGQPASYDVRYQAGTITWGGTALSVTQGTCATPVAGTAIGGKRACTVLGLTPATAYQFQLVAFRGTLSLNAVFGGLSNIAGATTTASTSGGSGAPQPGPTDPIIFQDGFESGDLSSWTQNPSAGRYSLATDPTRVHAGRQSLQVLFTPTNGYGLITRWFMPGYDEIYVRFYVMFQEGFLNQRSDGAGMHFLTICGNNSTDSQSCWGKPAIVPNGTDYFYAGLDPEEVSLPTLQPLSFYTYWPDMSCCYGNVLFQSSPKVALVGGQWQEVVFHIKLNTPGQADGLQEVWLNGVKTLSQQNMRWRTTTDLHVNEIRFDNYMPGAPQTQYLWIDDVTVWRP